MFFLKINYLCSKSINVLLVYFFTFSSFLAISTLSILNRVWTLRAVHSKWSEGCKTRRADSWKRSGWINFCIAYFAKSNTFITITLLTVMIVIIFSPNSFIYYIRNDGYNDQTVITIKIGFTSLIVISIFHCIIILLIFNYREKSDNTFVIINTIFRIPLYVLTRFPSCEKMVAATMRRLELEGSTLPDMSCSSWDTRDSRAEEDD